MVEKYLPRLSASDVKFLIEMIDPRLMDKSDVIRDDPAFIDHLLDEAAERAFQKITILSDENALTRISPRFLFEILLRKAAREIGNRPFILERSASQRIPVFDTREVSEFIRNKEIVRYMADMLDSFTHIESYTFPIRVRKGIWRRARFSDMDIHSLLKVCLSVDEADRFKYYKRIGDLCLFILGMFPEYAAFSLDMAGASKPPAIMSRRAVVDYEAEGKRFYRLAAKHDTARVLGLDEILKELDVNFHLARRPLNYISENYLQFRKQKLWRVPGQN